MLHKVVSKSSKISAAFSPPSLLTAWLQNASIRDNILFGLPYVEKRYQDTLEACSLVKDLSILEDGDMTEIGEKGVRKG
jgi:ABC-type multidrug transport system fused ATPase/permease subunit